MRGEDRQQAKQNRRRPDGQAGGGGAAAGRAGAGRRRVRQNRRQGAAPHGDALELAAERHGGEHVPLRQVRLEALHECDHAGGAHVEVAGHAAELGGVSGARDWGFGAGVWGRGIGALFGRFWGGFWLLWAAQQCCVRTCVARTV